MPRPLHGVSRGVGHGLFRGLVKSRWLAAIGGSCGPGTAGPTPTIHRPPLVETYATKYN